ncbi:MAG: hypothetical protein EZS28_000837 [Streblomastix strix]|uniref:SPRY domain-containing protein n=1 Tax=Streblomastix strix TaxID=222440 RepID=A0A5J4X8R0_9EUKA|nr:MAG: hypothetical protein EZS28_000837 [Streblomastix strix]
MAALMEQLLGQDINCPIAIYLFHSEYEEFKCSSFIFQQVVAEIWLKKQASKSKFSAVDAQKDSSPYTALIPSEEDTKVIGETFTSTSTNHSTILFDPVVEKGIVKFEIQNVQRVHCVGIADESMRYSPGEEPGARGWEKMAEYNFEGTIGRNFEWTDDNATFKTDDVVTMELDMEASPRTLTFFVNGKEQPNYVSKVPAAVRFFVHLSAQDQAFKIIKFETLPEPTAKHDVDDADDWRF